MTGEIVKFEPPIDGERAAELLKKHVGNVAKVADFMGVNSGKLRRFIEKHAELQEVIGDAFEDAVDEAIGVLLEGLRDEASFQNRFYAAKEILRSSAGRRRGFGPPTPGNVLIAEARETSQARTIELKWIEPVLEPVREEK